MSLATRCNACGTVFRVVEDQLKVSEGWVRCGRCQQVFNAVESLFDLEREAPPPWTPPPAAAPPPPAESRDAAEQVFGPDPGLAQDSAPVDLLLDLPSEPPDEPSADDLFDALIDGRPPGQEEVAGGGVDIDIDAVPEDAELQAGEDVVDIMLDDAPPPTQAAEASSASYLTREAAPTQQADFAEPDDAPAHAPTFLTAAERAERWRRSPLRLGYAVAALGLALALLLQVSLHYRDALAVAWPEARGTLAGLCRLAGCELEAPRRLESISVDSSGLTRNADGSGYKLSVVLRNRAAYEVALPAVELSLTDSSGELIARRTLLPADFQHAAASLPASGLTPLELVLNVAGGKPISGYTVEVFYP